QRHWKRSWQLPGMQSVKHSTAYNNERKRNMRNYVITILLAGMMLATAYAIQAPPEAPLAPTVQAALPAPQVPPPAPPAPLVKTALPPEQPAPPAAKAAPVREALPELTEAEKMKLENLQLKAALLARQERDTIENQHPE